MLSLRNNVNIELLAICDRVGGYSVLLPYLSNIDSSILGLIERLGGAWWYVNNCHTTPFSQFPVDTNGLTNNFYVISYGQWQCRSMRNVFCIWHMHGGIILGGNWKLWQKWFVHICGWLVLSNKERVWLSKVSFTWMRHQIICAWTVRDISSERQRKLIKIQFLNRTEHC